MERKYRQRGYMDSDRDRDREKSEKRTTPREERIGPRTPNLPGRRTVIRCASCALILPPELDMTGKCPRCAFELHSCKQCTFFDTGARFECSQPITARIPRKDQKNHCSFFSARTTVEKETTSSRPNDARTAFENLFKK